MSRVLARLWFWLDGFNMSRPLDWLCDRWPGCTDELEAIYSAWVRSQQGGRHR